MPSCYIYLYAIRACEFGKKIFLHPFHVWYRGGRGGHSSAAVHEIAYGCIVHHYSCNCRVFWKHFGMKTLCNVVVTADIFWTHSAMNALCAVIVTAGEFSECTLRYANGNFKIATFDDGEYRVPADTPGGEITLVRLLQPPMTKTSIYCRVTWLKNCVHAALDTWKTKPSQTNARIELCIDPEQVIH